MGQKQPGKRMRETCPRRSVPPAPSHKAVGQLISYRFLRWWFDSNQVQKKKQSVTNTNLKTNPHALQPRLIFLFSV